MSVIAKLCVRGRYPVSEGHSKVEAMCVCDNELLSPETENARFTKASPWGEMRFTQFTNCPPMEQGDEFYAVFTPITDPCPEVSGDQVILVASCLGITHFSTSRQFEWYGLDKDRSAELLKSAIDGGPRGTRLPPYPGFSFRMLVDNQNVWDRFEPGRNYWLVLSPARLGSAFALGL